jgi:hypothetical protein
MYKINEFLYTCTEMIKMNIIINTFFIYLYGNDKNEYNNKYFLIVSDRYDKRHIIINTFLYTCTVMIKMNIIN